MYFKIIIYFCLLIKCFNSLTYQLISNSYPNSTFDGLYNLISLRVNTKMLCFAKCENNNNCLSLVYIETTNTGSNCILYRQNAFGVNYLTPATQTKYYVKLGAPTTQTTGK